MAKSKYQEWLKPENLILIQGWAADGLTDADIAHNMGISLSTLNEWKKTHPDISESLKKSKEIADRIIENALFERAKGIRAMVKKPIKVRTIKYDKSGHKVSETEKIVYGEEEVIIPPDTTAAIFWLKNRKPEQWRDKRQVEEHVEFESDGFLEAIKADAVDTFQLEGVEDIVET